jgi:hypothetical protein
VYSALSSHAAAYRGVLGSPDLSTYEAQVFSQNGEDGVIAEILARIGVGERWFVEFGIGTGHQGNCVLLADAYGWSGLFCEPEPDQYAALARKYERTPAVRTAMVAITSANVEDVFRDHGVPEEPDVLSIDVDTIDFWIWKAITSFRSRLVVIEYNSVLSAERALVYPDRSDARWDGTAYYGSSLGALRRLGAEKGYRLVHTDLCGVNAFFVRNDLAGAVGVDVPPLRTANFGFVGATMPPDPLRRAWVDLDAPARE